MAVNAEIHFAKIFHSTEATEMRFAKTLENGYFRPLAHGLPIKVYPYQCLIGTEEVNQNIFSHKQS